MPNLLDCPQEIQDMIYEAYFTFTLNDYPLARIHRLFGKISAGILQVAVSVVDKELSAAEASHKHAEVTLSSLREVQLVIRFRSDPDRVRELESEARRLKGRMWDLENQIEQQKRTLAQLKARAKWLRGGGGTVNRVEKGGEGSVRG